MSGWLKGVWRGAEGLPDVNALESSVYMVFDTAMSAKMFDNCIYSLLYVR